MDGWIDRYIDRSFYFPMEFYQIKINTYLNLVFTRSLIIIRNMNSASMGWKILFVFVTVFSEQITFHT